jgi:hypothetical protein
MSGCAAEAQNGQSLAQDPKKEFKSGEVHVLGCGGKDAEKKHPKSPFSAA